MAFLWGGILIVLLLAVLWTSRDRGADIEEEELERHKKEGESWTLESAEDTAQDHEGE